MYTLYYGTNNAAKVNHMKNTVKELPLTIIGTNEMANIDHDIDESGKEPLENARIKAWHYYRQIHRPIFSIDSGLFFKNVEYKDQPGTHVRRVNGIRMNDMEALDYYSKLAEKYGGELEGYYKNAICIVLDQETVIEHDGKAIDSDHFILSSTPHKKLVEGWPLDSLSKEIKSGKYYYDIHHSMNITNGATFRELFIGIFDKLDTRDT